MSANLLHFSIFLEIISADYLTSFSFYNSVKNASKMNVPGKDTVIKELSKKFEFHGKKPAPEEQGFAI